MFSREMCRWSVLLLLCLAVLGEQGEPLSLRELVAHSDLIVHGTVVSKTVSKSPQGKIYTEVELKLHDVWKGDPKGDRITFVHGGGILGEYRVEVTGQASYTLGEEVVLFLARSDAEHWVTLGMAWGKYSVRAGANGKTASQSGVPGAETIALDNLKQNVLSLFSK